MRRGRWVLVLAAVLLPWTFLSPIGSQVVVVPSKEDRILEKLDLVISQQKEMRATLERLAKALGEKDAPKAEEKKKR
jgi:hypothetical protein